MWAELEAPSPFLFAHGELDGLVEFIAVIEDDVVGADVFGGFGLRAQAAVLGGGAGDEKLFDVALVSAFFGFLGEALLTLVCEALPDFFVSTFFKGLLEPVEGLFSRAAFAATLQGEGGREPEAYEATKDEPGGESVTLGVEWRRRVVW